MKTYIVTLKSIGRLSVQAKYLLMDAGWVWFIDDKNDTVAYFATAEVVALWVEGAVAAG